MSNSPEENAVAVREQMEYYFSDCNWPRDRYLRSLGDELGWIAISALLEFPKLRDLVNKVSETDKVGLVARAVSRSQLIEVLEDEKKVRRVPSSMCREVVLDANALIACDSLADKLKEASALWTVSRVLAEVRDPKSRQKLASLPLAIEVGKPTTEAMNWVRSSARDTGDLRALSLADIEIIALTLDLETRAAQTSAHLRRPRSLAKKDVSLKPIESDNKNTAITQNTFMTKKHAPSTKSRIASPHMSWAAAVINDSCDADNSATVEGDTGHDSSQPEEEDMSNVVIVVAADDSTDTTKIPKIKKKIIVEDEGYREDDEASTTTDTTGVDLEALSLHSMKDHSSLRAQHESESNATEDKENEEVREEDHDADDERPVQHSRILGNFGAMPVMSVEDDDGIGWVGPVSNEPNNTKTGSTHKNDDLPLCRTACATADFAMQNVLLAIGLRVLSLDGRVVKRPRRFVIRCGACFALEAQNLERLFCGRCGSDALHKTPVGPDGTVSHRVANRVTSRRSHAAHSKQPQKKMAPKTGQRRFDGDALLREDQLLTGIWRQKVQRAKAATNKSSTDSFFGEHFPSSTTTTSGRTSLKKNGTSILR